MTAMPNAELAYRVLDYIDAHPDEWNQKYWVCGSAACFAGWAVRLSGGTIVQNDPEDTDAVVTAGPDEIVGMGADQAAEHVLGMLRFEHHSDLFDGYNTRKELGEIVAEIFGPRPDAAS